MQAEVKQASAAKTTLEAQVAALQHKLLQEQKQAQELRTQLGALSGELEQALRKGEELEPALRAARERAAGAEAAAEGLRAQLTQAQREIATKERLLTVGTSTLALKGLLLLSDCESALGGWPVPKEWHLPCAPLP